MLNVETSLHNGIFKTFTFKNIIFKLKKLYKIHSLVTLHAANKIIQIFSKLI